MDIARPPGPSISALDALRAFRRDPIGLLSRAAACGDVAYLHLPRFHAYVVNSPDLVRDVLVTGAKDFMKGPTMQAAKLVLGENLLTSEEPHHMRRRRLMQPLFHHERITGYGDTMVRLAERASARWVDGSSLDVHQEMARLTLAIVGATVFDTDVETEDARAVTRALSDLLAMFDRVYSPIFQLLIRLPVPATRRFERRRREVTEIVDRMIAERRAAAARGDDLLSLLLRAQADGIGLTDDEVRDEALTLFLAGHETTSNALTWTWWLLSEHPEVEARLHEELDATLGERPPSVEDLDRLRYTSMVLDESMRLRPPAWAIGRRAIADHELGGFIVPRGAVVVVSPYLLHHDARWYPDPEAFRPERWAWDADASRPRTAFLPFGAGSRMCIGEGFARVEAALLLATIARRWRLHLVPGHPVELQPAVTLRPKHGMVMTLERRRA
jgi:cytochrome P450